MGSRDDGTSMTAWQRMRALLGRSPRTSTVRELGGEGGHPVAIRCDRSMPVELVTELMGPFMALWDAHPRVSLSDYDPALAGALTAASTEKDVHLLWLDWRRYGQRTPAELAAWLGDLVARSRAGNARPAPVLVNDWPRGGVDAGLPDPWVTELAAELGALSQTLDECWVLRLSELAERMPGELFDTRNDALIGFPFSNAATLAIARHLGAQLLPALLVPRLKLIVLDLDDTLYAGVLGEEGPAGVRVTDGHARLQRKLLALREQGYLLALCSHNVEEDARALFEQRTDFGLRWSDFAGVRIGWTAKAEGVSSLAAEMHIDPSAVLFVDDNPAELGAMASAVPSAHLLLASDDADETASMLEHHPGLFRLRRDTLGTQRSLDIQANQLRARLRQQADPEQYWTRLETVVEIEVNNTAHVARIHELSHKTNQFNLALARLTEAEARAAVAPPFFTATVSLRDAISDSGLVGVLVFRVEGGRAELRELLLSCRALGRNVEVLALHHCLEHLQRAGVASLSVVVREGPRNQPARDFARAYLPSPDEVSPIADVAAVTAAACRHVPARVIMRP